MLIHVSSLLEIYNEIVKNSQYGTVSVLVFVPYTVDSLAARSILFELFLQDDVLTHYIFVKGYEDLENNIMKRIEEETLPPSIIFLNCGGSISLIRKFPSAFENSKAYVIDSHRPIHLDNLDSRVNQVLVLDDSQSIFSSLGDIPNSSKDIDECIIVQGFQKLKDGSLKQIEKRIDPEAEEAKQYLKKAYFSDPASIQVYSLASIIRTTSTQSLWFSILGLTEHFILEHIDNYRYESLFEIISNEASRLSGHEKMFTTIIEGDGTETIRPESGIQVRVFQDYSIAPSNEIRCPMLKHWTLYESIHSSSFVASRLKLWYKRGYDNLLTLLAKIGVPLKDANTAYHIMNTELRDSLVERFDQQCDKFGLKGIIFPSFILRHGFEPELGAADVVLALRSRLNIRDSTTNESFSSMRILENSQLLYEGIESAKKRSKMVITCGIEIMSRRVASIINAGYFRLTTIRNAQEKNIPIDTSFLIDLGQFLIQSMREELQSKETDTLPIIVAALDQKTDIFTVVALSTGFEFGEVESSRFGALFSVAAKRAEVPIVMDSFDSFVCQVPNDHFPSFIDNLTHLAFVEAQEYE